MATVYVLLMLAVLVLVVFVWYVTRPPSKKNGRPQAEKIGFRNDASPPRG